MKKIIGEILNTERTPEGIKERLLASAKAHILLKDLGDLFGSNIPKTSKDIAETIVESKKTSNSKHSKK